jgi:hypothetical protein
MAGLLFCLLCTLLLLLLRLISLFRALLPLLLLLPLLSLLLCLFFALLRLLRALLYCTQEPFECSCGPWILHLEMAQNHCDFQISRRHHRTRRSSFSKPKFGARVNARRQPLRGALFGLFLRLRDPRFLL